MDTFSRTSDCTSYPIASKENAMSKTARGLVLIAPLVGLSLFAPPAGADMGEERPEPRDREVVAALHPIEGTGIEGHGHAEVEFDQEGVIDEYEVVAHGLLADAPHAVHIHFGEEARHECPTLADDTSGDGRLTTSEGAPAYGPVQLSLTTSGDTSPKSVLAIDRFNTAPGGLMHYERDGFFETAEGVAEAIADGEGVVVVHGVDYNGNGMYDFSAGKSDLDATLPAEATNPAMCGVLENDHEDDHDHEND
jgi:hypothetical protein